MQGLRGSKASLTLGEYKENGLHSLPRGKNFPRHLNHKPVSASTFSLKSQWDDLKRLEFLFDKVSDGAPGKLVGKNSHPLWRNRNPILNIGTLSHLKLGKEGGQSSARVHGEKEATLGGNRQQ